MTKLNIFKGHSMQNLCEIWKFQMILLNFYKEVLYKVLHTIHTFSALFPIKIDNANVTY